MPELTAAAWVLLALGAVAVGFAKTAIGGVGSLAVVAFALALPARESTGALLPLLICGDLVALALYRGHGSWSTLVRLMPGVVPGILLGAWFVALVDDTWMRRSIGLLLLAMTLQQLWARRPRSGGPRAIGRQPHPALAAVVGVAAGFTTMTANAGGPVMTLYLVLAGLPMLRMLGTAAWFFFAVNLLKVPFSAGLDLISARSLVMDLALVPALLAGALLGHRCIRRMGQLTFERAALALSGVAAGLLLLWP